MRFHFLLAATLVMSSAAIVPAQAADEFTSYLCQAVDVPDDPFYQGLNTLSLGWQKKTVVFDHDGGAEAEEFLMFYDHPKPTPSDPSTITVEAGDGYLLFVETGAGSTTMATFTGDLSHVDVEISTVEKGKRLNATYSCDAA